jgi:hypothetical protein
VHAPLHAKPEDIAAYRGRYAEGWDRLREQRFARQVAHGLFPLGTRMAPPNREPGLAVRPWDELPADERELFARYMEVYAAMVDNVDQNLARLLGTIDALGELDNTIVLFTADNGGSGEGGERGSRSYLKQFVSGTATPADWGPDVPRELDLIGGPQSMVHYPRGWAMASNTPFRLYKRQTHAGGVRVPLLMSWPRGILGGGIRHQYQYVTDVAPTLLDLIGVEQLPERAGQSTQPVDGTSFAPVLVDAAAPSTHREQYAEMGGNRGFYRDQWKLVTLHQAGQPYDDTEWQLYDIATDPTETTDLAARRPDKVAELAAAWEKAAWANGVFPLDDGTGYLRVIRRPDEEAFREPLTLLPGTPSLERYRSARLIAFRSFDIDVRFTHDANDEGVLVAHGDQGGGYSLYVESGRLHFAYNAYGALTEVDGGSLPAGGRTVRLAATATSDLRWDFLVSIDEREVGRLDGVPMLVGMAPLSGIDVGIDRRSPVSWPLYEKHGPFPYSGRLTSVRYLPGEPAGYSPEVLARALREAATTFE